MYTVYSVNTLRQLNECVSFVHPSLHLLNCAQLLDHPIPMLVSHNMLTY